MGEFERVQSLPASLLRPVQQRATDKEEHQSGPLWTAELQTARPALFVPQKRWREAETQKALQLHFASATLCASSQAGR